MKLGLDLILKSNIPLEYKIVIKSYINEVIKNLKNRVKLILVIGSSASNEVITNWSDIDIILVCDKYDMEYVRIIKNIISKYDIKIGNTIYSQEEFEKKQIDPKTYYYLLLAQEEKINIQYLNKDLKIPEIGFEECKKQYVTYLMEQLHNYKRNMLYENIDKEGIGKIFKNTYLIMKAILIINNFRPKNYQEVFSLYSREYGFEKLNFKKFIQDYQNGRINNERFMDYSKKFIIDIVNNPKI
ncbi:MAG: hypothetical protein Q4G05_06425 [Clostridia bacterium]|nr:hypothetical protein [Clostridia bacterium]